MKHTDKCKQQQRKEQWARDTFTELYPNHCPICNGWGVHSYIENLAPHGEGFWGCQMSEPCGCTEQGLCGRCRMPGLDKDTLEGPCRFCGWNYDDGMPYEFSDYCDCGLNEEI
jgi:hypothetical protein